MAKSRAIYPRVVREFQGKFNTRYRVVEYDKDQFCLEKLVTDFMGGRSWLNSSAWSRDFFNGMFEDLLKEMGRVCTSFNVSGE